MEEDLSQRKYGTNVAVMSDVASCIHQKCTDVSDHPAASITSLNPLMLDKMSIVIFRRPKLNGGCIRADTLFGTEGLHSFGFKY